MEFLGDDIKLDDTDDIVINIGSGDFSTSSGIDCLLQDIKEEFEFSYMDDPEHPERGNLFMKFINSDSSMNKLVLLEMKAEAKRILSRDPRINKDSIKVSISSDTEGWSVSCSFDTVDGKTVENLVVPISKEATL